MSNSRSKKLRKSFTSFSREVDIMAAWTLPSGAATVDHFTTFPCDSIPANGLELFRSFLEAVEKEWTSIGRDASQHLVNLVSPHTTHMF